jgi:cation diffusion facilitator family transporter
VTPQTEPGRTAAGIRLALVGLLVNAVLVAVKLAAGFVGHSYVLVADGVESLADIFTSLIVWSGLRVSTRSADDTFPFGYGKAQPLAAAAVGLMLIAAAVGIAVEAARELVTPHHGPAAFTLPVLVLVVVSKELLFRTVLRAGRALDARIIEADAWHHRSDAVTSLLAFIGISVALIGGPGWEPADDAAALLATLVIVANGIRVLRPAVLELMDRAPGPEVVDRVSRAARGVPGVQAIEKLRVSRAGTRCRADLHVQADPALSLEAAHVLSGRVKHAIRDAVPMVEDVLVHMEPFSS